MGSFQRAGGALPGPVSRARKAVSAPTVPALLLSGHESLPLRPSSAETTPTSPKHKHSLLEHATLGPHGRVAGASQWGRRGPPGRRAGSAEKVRVHQVLCVEAPGQGVELGRRWDTVAWVTEGVVRGGEPGARRRGAGLSRGPCVAGGTGGPPEA